MVSIRTLRTVLRRGPVAFSAGIAGLIAQGYYAGHRALPHFLDQDGSGTFGPEDATPIRIVAIGDSMFTGPGLLDVEDLWIRQVIDRLGPSYRVELHIFARGGSWARDIRDEQLHGALALRPDIAMISGGSNDAARGVPLQTISAELTLMAGALVEVASTVILTGVGDMGTIPRMPQPLASVLSWRSKKADRLHAGVAARHPRIVNLAMWDEGSQPFRENPGLFTSDLFHPNAAGQAVWADLAYPVMATAFRQIEVGRTS